MKNYYLKRGEINILIKFYKEIYEKFKLIKFDFFIFFKKNNFINIITIKKTIKIIKI
jgi:hypothetical protein